MRVVNDGGRTYGSLRCRDALKRIKIRSNGGGVVKDYNALSIPMALSWFTGAQNKINTLANCNHYEQDRI